jgi:membrane protein implicated in regulation of membrane protease activity
MRYFVLWVGTLAAIVLAVMAVAGMIWLWTQLWWLPLAILFALLIATIVVAIDWWTDHPRVPRGPEEIDLG